jgi:TolB protein
MRSIWIANSDGGNPRQIIEMAMWPSLSPDGKQVAYYRIKDSGIYIANSDGGNPHKVLGFADTCCVQWSPDSKQLVYFRGNPKFGGSIFTATIDGKNITEIASGFNPAWSPDGNKIIYANCQENTSHCGLFVLDLKTKAGTMITRDNGANPQWSPRGDKIVYQKDDGNGHVNVFLVKPDGTGVKQLTSGKGNDGQPTWSRDGNLIFWRSDQNGKGWSIFAMNADGTRPRLVIPNTPPDPERWGRESLTASP